MHKPLLFYVLWYTFPHAYTFQRYAETLTQPMVEAGKLADYASNEHHRARKIAIMHSNNRSQKLLHLATWKLTQNS